MRMKLTERAVARLRAPDPSGKQVLHWDEELRGFGVLCSGVSNARTYVAQRELPNGRTRRVTIAAVTEMPLVEARRIAADTLVDMRRGIDPKAARRRGTTLRGTLDAYLAARKSLRPNTIRGYRDAVEDHLAAWIDMPLSEITSDMVEARHRSLQTEIAGRGRYGGRATANSAMRTLRALWSFAAERDPTLPPNPVRRLRRQWFPVHRRERMVRADQLPAFYAAVQALPNTVARDYLLLLLFTGLRRSEAASLTWDDVDFAARVIRVPAARTKAGRKLDLPMSDFVRDMLVARRTIGDAHWIFSASSKTGHIQEPKSPLAEVAAATGIRVSAHDLRRTFITTAESCDISVMALKALVNHALGSDVTGGYVQMTVERLRGPAQRVAHEMKRLCGVAAAPEGAIALRRT